MRPRRPMPIVMDCGLHDISHCSVPPASPRTRSGGVMVLTVQVHRGIWSRSAGTPSRRRARRMPCRGQSFFHAFYLGDIDAVQVEENTDRQSESRRLAEISLKTVSSAGL